MPREQMLEARRAGDGVREPSLPGPGCSAAQSWSGFNLTSWSSYREFADHSQCQADLAPTACLLLAKTTAVGEPALLSDRAQQRERRGDGKQLAGEGRELQKWQERMNHVLNIKTIKDFQAPNSLFSPP